nr:MAG TPA: hypothetical protein [Caudoviricetes sp.]
MPYAAGGQIRPVGRFYALGGIGHTDGVKPRHRAHRDAQRASGAQGIAQPRDSRSGYSLPRVDAGRAEKPRRSRQALPGLCMVWLFMVKP